MGGASSCLADRRSLGTPDFDGARELVLVRYEIYVVPACPRSPASFCAFATDIQQTTLFLRLRTNDPTVFGIASTQAFGCSTAGDTSVAENLKWVLGGFLNRSVAAAGPSRESPEEARSSSPWEWDSSLFGALEELKQTHQPLMTQVISIIDIALWDLKARVLNVPLYQLICQEYARVHQGATPAPTEEPFSLTEYGSMPFLREVSKWIPVVDDLVGQGYKTLKCHGFGVLAEDVELVNTMCTKYPGIQWMLDVEAGYRDVNDALKLAAAVSSHRNFVLLEAPMSDADFQGYVQIRRACPGLGLLPAGSELLDPTLIDGLLGMLRAAGTLPWTSARFDVSIVGGVTAGLRFVAAAQRHGLPAELIMWGHGLSQLANLHLMCGCRVGKYFERPIPIEGYDEWFAEGSEYESVLGSVGAERRVLPRGALAGLGVDMDWAGLEASGALYHAHGATTKWQYGACYYRSF